MPNYFKFKIKIIKSVGMINKRRDCKIGAVAEVGVLLLVGGR
jgi:hypothetical protein